MSLLHTKALNCQLLALAILTSGSISFGQALPNRSSIIPKAKTSSLAAHPSKKPTARPVAKKTRPQRARPSTGIQGLCAKLLSAIQPKSAAEKTTAPAPIATEVIATAPAETLAPAAPTLEAVQQLLTDTDTFRTQFESSNKPDDQAVFEAKAQEYLTALKAYLDSKSIHYIVTATQDKLSDGTPFEWPSLVLSAEGDHRLNRFAAGMKRRYDVNLALDFILLRRLHNVAAFLSSGSLTLSEEALANERPGIDDIEEILHVRFAAERNERDLSVGHVPVQMYFVSNAPIRSERLEHDYMTEMTFEDIWAQAVKISIAANQAKDKLTAEDLTTIKNMVEYLAAMTDTAEIAVDRAKESTLDGQPAVLNRRKDESAYLVFGYEKEFNFATFIPQMAIDNSGDYAIREMNDAVRLTKFMREYFYEPEGQTPAPEELFAKALNFKSALYQFITEIGRSKPTAEATYDVVASFDLFLKDFAQDQ